MVKEANKPALQEYDPRNCPGYNNMLDLVHYTGREAVLQDYPEGSIEIGGRTFGPWGAGWVSDEVIVCLNEDLLLPETCRYCHGGGWKDDTPKAKAVIPKAPCTNCQKGQEFMAKQKEKAKAERERQKDYLQRELDRLTMEYAHVEAQLMELDK